MVVRTNLIGPASKFEPMVKESNELISILLTSIETVRKKIKRIS